MPIDHDDTTMTLSGSTHQQLVVFALGREGYALPIRRVQEIVRYAEPRAVAAADAWIRGVISLRGDVLPVVDLGMRLSLPGETAPEQKIIVVDTEEGRAGIVVDEVEEVITVSPEQLDALPIVGTDAIDAVAKLGERLVLLLSPDRLLAGVARAVA